MYDFTARLAAISPPTPAEMALFRALARRQEDADMFLGVLAGSVPLRQFMSPRTMVRLVGVGPPQLKKLVSFSIFFDGLVAG